MGKYQRKSGVTQGQTSGTKAPLMKYGEAAHMADKNSKTMVKISQLLVVNKISLFSIYHYILYS
jgi:hypothetical protein